MNKPNLVILDLNKLEKELDKMVMRRRRWGHSPPGADACYDLVKQISQPYVEDKK